MAKDVDIFLVIIYIAMCYCVRSDIGVVLLLMNGLQKNKISPILRRKENLVSCRVVEISYSHFKT